MNPNPPYKFITRDIRDGLVLDLYPNYDNPAGSVLIDYSEIGNNATLVNAPTFDTFDRIGSKRAITFDGDDQYINIPTNVAYDEFNFTYVFLFKKPLVDMLTTEFLFSRSSIFNDVEENYYAYPVLVYISSNDRLKCTVRYALDIDHIDAVSLYTSSAITDNDWHLGSVVFDDSKLTFYIDGVLSSETTHELTARSDSANPIRIGISELDPNYNPSSASIGLFRLYNRALSLDELKTLNKFIYAKLGILPL